LLAALLALHKDREQRLDTLEDILSSLRSGYNPNYQDMAVLEAVRGWEQVAGLPHINDIKKDEDEIGEGSLPFDVQDDISSEETERQAESILKTDYLSLLMEHDEYAESPQASPTGVPLSHIEFSTS
jgi:protein kinase C substrate 80K-H